MPPTPLRSARNRVHIRSYEEAVKQTKAARNAAARVEKDIFENFGQKLEVQIVLLPSPDAITKGDGKVLLDSRIPLRSVYGLLYHEAGHTIFNDRLDWTRPRAGEFEADVFAGIASGRTGRSVEPFLRYLSEV